MLFKKKEKDDYIATKEYKGMVSFNEDEKTFKTNGKVFSFSDLKDVDLIIDNHSVTKGGLGRMITGGILLGPVGALVGGVTAKKKNKEIVDSMKIALQIDDFNNPLEEIVIFKGPIKKGGTIYKLFEISTNEIMATFEHILRNNGSI